MFVYKKKNIIRIPFWNNEHFGILISGILVPESGFLIVFFKAQLRSKMCF